jgi:hypothetical protein
MRARIYDPKLGRFLQPEPIGYDDGMNMYAYVGGDPVNMADPSGISRWPSRLELKRADSGSTGWGMSSGGGSGGGLLDSSGNVRVEVANNIFWERRDGSPGQWGGNVVAVDGKFYLNNGGPASGGPTYIAGSPAFGVHSENDVGTRIVHHWVVRGLQNGSVVQEVTQTYQRNNGQNYRIRFWEGWELRNGRWQEGGNTDSFDIPRPGDVRSFTVTGVANLYGRYLPNSMQAENVPQAGILRSSKNDPNMGTPIGDPIRIMCIMGQRCTNF